MFARIQFNAALDSSFCVPYSPGVLSGNSRRERKRSGSYRGHVVHREMIHAVLSMILRVIFGLSDSRNNTARIPEIPEIEVTLNLRF